MSPGLGLVIFGVVGLVFLWLYLIDYKQGSKDIESRILELDKYDPNIGSIAAGHQIAKTEARTGLLEAQTRELRALIAFEKARIEARYIKIITDLEQMNLIEVNKTMIMASQNKQAALAEASRLGKELIHLQQIELLLIGGDLGKALTEVERIKRLNLEELNKMDKQHLIEFENYIRLDEYKQKRLNELTGRTKDEE